MSWIQVIVLSIVQGITEFLPVSSSGHLAAVSQLFFHSDAGASFTAVIQLGTETAVLAYFGKDIINILRAWTIGVGQKIQLKHNNNDAVIPDQQKTYDTLNYRLGWYVIIGTIPICCLGIAFKDIIRSQVRHLSVVGLALIIFSIVIALSEYYGKQNRHENQLTSLDAFLIGAGQALALIPGVSRSGATISTGLFLGLDRELSARFGFLLAIPAVFAAGIFSLPDAFHPQQTGLSATAAQLIVGTLIAFVVGWAVIAWFLRFLTTHSMYWFVIYRICAGLLILCLPISSAPLES